MRIVSTSAASPRLGGQARSLRVCRQHKLAWITHTTKSSGWCASAGEVLAWAPMLVTYLGFASIVMA